MKRLIFTQVIGLAVTCAFAQSNPSDTSHASADSTKITRPQISVNNDDDTSWSKDTTTYRHHKSYPKVTFGITFSRFDLGLATLIDNGSFTLSQQNQFLRYNTWKTSNVGFDVLQLGVRFSDSFKIYLSGGFDWTNIRLRDNITILPDQHSLSFRPDNISYSKNRFSSSYLRIPLSFDFRSKQDARGNRFHFVLGPDCGFLLTASVKQISAENGKQKFNDTYNYATFRYGGFARIGYGDWGLFAKYYVNNMFENSPDQAGLRNLSFGLTVGF